MSPLEAPQRDIYSVSRLVRETRAVLEGSFPLLWISGEISNLAQPASGHIYFSLKDEAAQVRCAMFRMKRQQLRFQPANGQQVLVRARLRNRQVIATETARSGLRAAVVVSVRKAKRAVRRSLKKSMQKHRWRVDVQPVPGHDAGELVDGHRSPVM